MEPSETCSLWRRRSSTARATDDDSSVDERLASRKAHDARRTPNKAPAMIPTLTSATDDDSSADERLASRAAHEVRPSPNATPDSSVVKVARQTRLSTTQELRRQGAIATIDSASDDGSSSDGQKPSRPAVRPMQSMDTDSDSDSSPHPTRGVSAAAIAGSSSGSDSSDDVRGAMAGNTTRNVQQHRATTRMPNQDLPRFSTQARAAPEARAAPARVIEDRPPGAMVSEPSDVEDA